MSGKPSAYKVEAFLTRIEKGKEMKNIIMAAGVALLMVGCGESEPSGKYQCEMEKNKIVVSIDSKNKSWDIVGDKGGSFREDMKKEGVENLTMTLTHNKDTEIYALNLSGVAKKEKETINSDIGTFKYDSDNDALNFVALMKEDKFTCKKID